MYWLLLAGLIAIAGSMLRSGIVHGSRTRQVLGGSGILAVFGFFALLSILSELYWFEAAGYEARFWRMLAAKVIATALGALLGWAGVLVFYRPSMSPPRWIRPGAASIGAMLGAFVGFGSWSRSCLFTGYHETPKSARHPGAGAGEASRRR